MSITTKTIKGFLSFEEAKNELIRTANLLNETENETALCIRIKSCKSLLHLLETYSENIITKCDHCKQDSETEYYFTFNSEHLNLCPTCYKKQEEKELKIFNAVVDKRRTK